MSKQAEICKRILKCASLNDLEGMKQAKLELEELKE